LPNKTLPLAEDAIKDKSAGVIRAIAMHLLREGNFEVAQTFLREASPSESAVDLMLSNPSQSPTNPDFTSLRPADLQERFASMYSILDSLRNHHDPLPALTWARENSSELERRGSNLEFELTRLLFVHTFLGPSQNLPGALQLARELLPRFQGRYMKEIQQLSAALAFAPNLSASPYSSTFALDSAWPLAASTFTRDYCSLLGLSASSPLYLAITAGCISLPTLLKLASIMKEKRTEWTTQHELPVEIPLPEWMSFHSVFVCPVSKEQATESNPPMMMPCGHVVAKESLGRLSRGGRFKCPYCPGESWPRDAKRIYL
jgi:hypothetical protein